MLCQPCQRRAFYMSGCTTTSRNYRTTARGAATMASKPRAPKVADLEIEGLARRMAALFPSSERVHATMMLPKKPSPEWRPGDKVVAKYVTVRRGPAISDWVDHLSGVRGLSL